MATPAIQPTTYASSPASETRLRTLQVAEVYRLAPAAAAFSYFGVLLTLGVLVEIGDTVRGALWFLYASAITFFRAFLFVAHRRRTDDANPEAWARLMLVANVLAGIQWGVLGTILFPAAPVYAQLFALMVIICFVAGSVTAYSALRGLHESLSIPATLPTAFHVFFLHDGPHWYAGIAAMFFCFAIIHYSGRLHRHLEATYRLQMERDDLVALTSELNEKLEGEKLELAHRVAMRGVSVESAREEASRLAALIERSPLPHLECDPAGKVISANSAAQRLFGRSRAQLSGCFLTSLLAGPTAGMRFTDLEQTQTVEVDVRAGDGTTLPCTASFTPLPAPAGQRGGFGVILAGLPLRVA
jgi:PAS domain S-box-containing protein